jgi:hypothetical protein
VYIYCSLAEAKAGERQGGSGFIVSIPMGRYPEASHPYLVTNRHVIVKAKTPVVRVNRHDGGIECISTEISQWSFHPDGDDIAVMPIDVGQEYSKQIKFRSVELAIFVTPEIIASEDIGIGDDTIMIGRFINHEGKQQNMPAVRFGNIAMMPKEKIVSTTGIAQESFLVEIKSLPGYSGSAVILLSPGAGPGSPDMSKMRKGQNALTRESDMSFTNSENMETLMTFMAPKGPYLLGIDWCHIHQRVPVLNAHGNESLEHWYVEQNSGMAGVIPAWKIAETLKCQELIEMRRQVEDRLARRIEESTVME